MKLTARLALSQLKVNRRRTIWTFIGILLSTAMLTTIYNLGYGSGMNWVDRITMGNAVRDAYLAVVSGIAIVMSAFVICISVIVISNAFRVSATERLSQFGILKSTGATKRQITQTVVYEGIFLTFIAIPLGIVIGLLFQWFSIGVINNVIEPMLNVEAANEAAGFVTIDDYLFRFILSPFGIVLSIGVSIFTVFLSAYLPARKAALVPAINAIRGTGEVKISNKKIRGGRLVKKLFKTEGMLARTFLKRNKKNFRATVIAVSFSVAVFILAGSIHTQVSRFAFIAWTDEEVDVQINIAKQTTIQVDCDEFDEETPGFFYSESIDVDGNRTRICHRDLPHEERSIATPVFLEVHNMLAELLSDEDQLFGIANITNHRTIVKIPRAAFTSDFTRARALNESPYVRTTDDYLELSLTLQMVDPEFHRELAYLAGVDEDSNILINHGREFTADNMWVDVTMLNEIIYELNLYEWDDDWRNVYDTGETFAIHGMISATDRPAFVNSGSTQSLTVLVPMAEHLIDFITWVIQTEDSTRIHLEAQTLLFDYFENDSINVWATDVRGMVAEGRDTLGLVLFFLAAFVAVLILIALTNVISTISENVKTRSKEFAVLQSVGMTNGGIKSMLSLESVFASINSLFIGVPLGVLGSYGIFMAMGNVGHFRFPFPWLWIVIAVLGVFLITWVTMQFAASKLKEQNIIETIRNGSGM